MEEVNVSDLMAYALPGRWAGHFSLFRFPGTSGKGGNQLLSVDTKFMDNERLNPGEEFQLLS